jgi:hypothetical protein
MLFRIVIYLLSFFLTIYLSPAAYKTQKNNTIPDIQHSISKLLQHDNLSPSYCLLKPWFICYLIEILDLYPIPQNDILWDSAPVSDCNHWRYGYTWLVPEQEWVV